MFENKFYQLEEKQPTTVFKKDTVTIEEHLNGEIKINLKDKYLNYIILPEKPKKQNIPVCALTNQKSEWIPYKDHPWRKFEYSSNSNKSNNETQILTKNLTPV